MFGDLKQPFFHGKDLGKNHPIDSQPFLFVDGHQVPGLTILNQGMVLCVWEIFFFETLEPHRS